MGASRSIQAPTHRSRMTVPRAVACLAITIASLAGVMNCATPPTHPVVFPQDPLARANPRSPGAVLMVLSAAPEQTLADGSTRRTGYFLNEFHEPYRALVDAGYDVVIATPGGRVPALDPESLKPSYWKDHPEALAEAQALTERLPKMRAPMPLSEARARAEEFQALIVPGGQGVMVDLLDDADLHGLLIDFSASDRPVGLICHAPAILTRLPGDPRPFMGRRVTSVSGFEEWYIETFVMGANAQVRGLGDRLDDAGYRHETALPGRSRAVRDCNLVTSQNPFSGAEFSALFLAALADWRQGGRCSTNDEAAPSASR